MGSHVLKLAPRQQVSRTLWGIFFMALPASGLAQETGTAPRYQGQSTQADLGQPNPSPPQPEVTYQETQEVFPEPEAGYVSEGYDLRGFRKIWDQRNLAMQRGEQSLELRLLGQLAHRKIAAGWPNLFSYARILARQADQAAREGRFVLAAARAEHALALAPQQPGVHALAGRVLLSLPEYGPQGIQALVRSLWLNLAEPGHFRVLAGQVLFALWLSVLAASLVFALVMGFRASSELRAAIHRMFPVGSPAYQATVLGAVLLAIPILFGFGVTLALVWWLTLSGFWMSRSERLAAVAVLLWVALLPLTLPFALGHLQYPGSQSEIIYTAARDIGTPALDDALARLPNQNATVLYLQGMRESWRGHPENALAFLEKAVRVPGAGAAIWTALGNHRYRMGQKTHAVEAYDEALARDPKRVMALFNKSRVLYGQADHARAGAAHELASDIDLEAATRLSQKAQESDVFFVADEPIAAGLLHAGAWSLHVEPTIADSLWSRFSPYSRQHCSILGLVGLGLVLITLFTRQTLARAEHRHLARGFSSRSRAVTQDAQDRSSQIREHIRAHRRQARLRRMRRLLSAVLAGGGHMVQGAPVTGLLFASCFLTTLILFLTSIDLVPGLVTTDGAALSLLAIPWGILVVSVYLLSILLRPEEDW